MSKETELFETERVPRKQPIVHGSHNLSGQIEWYTPKQYIDSANRVMGTIDCDPASSDLAQKVVNATIYHTLKDNGLAYPWEGTVWLNPPYTSKIVSAFVDKLLAHLQDREVTQAILLTHNNADTVWFHKACQKCAAACFTRGRVRFYNSNGTASSPTHGHTFMYFGRRVQKFKAEFCQYGWIVKGM